jgi:hypothetical protein
MTLFKIEQGSVGERAWLGFLSVPDRGGHPFRCKVCPREFSNELQTMGEHFDDRAHADNARGLAKKMAENRSISAMLGQHKMTVAEAGPGSGLIFVTGRAPLGRVRGRVAYLRAEGGLCHGGVRF